MPDLGYEPGFFEQTSHVLLQLVSRHVGHVRTVNRNDNFDWRVFIDQLMTDQLVDATANAISFDRRLVYLAANHHCRLKPFYLAVLKHVQTKQAGPGWPPVAIDTSHAVVSMKTILAR